MLMKGSVDYIVGYPYEAVYVARERNVEGQVVTLPLADTARYDRLRADDSAEEIDHA